MAKKLATKKENPLVAGGIDFAADAGAGMEGADKDSYAIPFLRVLQKISPQCDEADSQYIEGAKGGMILNTVTGELYPSDEGVIVLPCAFQRKFLRWAPRGSERGFMGEVEPEDVAEMRAEGIVKDFEGKLLVVNSEGEVSEKKSDRLVDTRSHFCIVAAEAGASQAVLPLSSTQIKKSKQLMSMLTSAKVPTENGPVTPPTWMNQIRMTTVLESNDQGSWYGVKFSAEGFIEDPSLYAAGKLFHDAIAAGELKVNYQADAEGAESTDGKF